MRIAVTTPHATLVGGMERYVDLVARGLAARGHEVALATDDVPSIGAEVASGIHRVAGGPREVPAWRPDVVFANRLDREQFELFRHRPLVAAVHDYYATCISGTKTYRLPTVRPCQAALGASCAFHYYPRRCGGWSPTTLLRRGVEARASLLSLRTAHRVVVLSRAMEGELLRNGIAAERLRRIRPPFESPSDPPPLDSGDENGPLRLLFVGRLESAKGIRLLPAAVAIAQQELARPVHLRVVGEGRESQWLAATAAPPGVTLDVVGWSVTPYAPGADLLLVPSLWPEPFGLVGIEAGLRRIPAVAFAVGGIPDWLEEGVNGHLVAAPPFSARLFAETIVRAIADAAHHERLRRGALEVASRFDLASHLDRLEEVLSEAVAECSR